MWKYPSRRNGNVRVDEMGKIVKTVDEMGIDEMKINLTRILES